MAWGHIIDMYWVFVGGSEDSTHEREVEQCRAVAEVAAPVKELSGSIHDGSDDLQQMGESPDLKKDVSGNSGCDTAVTEAVAIPALAASSSLAGVPQDGCADHLSTDCCDVPEPAAHDSVIPSKTKYTGDCSYIWLFS